MDNGAEYYRRFLSGEKEALGEIVRLYRDGLTIYINSIARNMDFAEEIMEETFIKLYVSRPKYSGKSSFKTWLFAIGRHTAIDYLRKVSRHRNVPDDDVHGLQTDDDLEKSYIRSEERMMLHKAIQSLKAEYSQILYLVYFESFTNTEAAVIMKKSDKQIRDLLYNAKKALKAELERRNFDYEGY